MKSVLTGNMDIVALLLASAPASWQPILIQWLLHLDWCNWHDSWAFWFPKSALDDFKFLNLEYVAKAMARTGAFSPLALTSKSIAMLLVLGAPLLLTLVHQLWVSPDSITWYMFFRIDPVIHELTSYHLISVGIWPIFQHLILTLFGYFSEPWSA